MLVGDSSRRSRHWTEETRYAESEGSSRTEGASKHDDGGGWRDLLERTEVNWWGSFEEGSGR